MKISKLMTKLAKKRDDGLFIAQQCQEAIDALSVIFIKTGRDIDIDSDPWFNMVYTKNEDNQ